MNNIRLKSTTVLAIAILFGSVLLYAVGMVRCQDIHPKHTDLEEFEAAIAFKGVEVISFDDRLVYWRKNLKMRVQLGSFGYDKDSKLPKGKEPGCYVAIYCRTHDFLYFLVSCKEEK